MVTQPLCLITTYLLHWELNGILLSFLLGIGLLLVYFINALINTDLKYMVHVVFLVLEEEIKFLEEEHLETE
jgi:hypothetical protein